MSKKFLSPKCEAGNGTFCPNDLVCRTGADGCPKTRGDKGIFSDECFDPSNFKQQLWQVRDEYGAQPVGTGSFVTKEGAELYLTRYKNGLKVVPE